VMPMAPMALTNGQTTKALIPQVYVWLNVPLGQHRR